MMSKISRNAPCPCGSGKKYKKCCIDKVLPFPTQGDVKDENLNKSEDVFQMLDNEIANNSFDSLEDANKKLSSFFQGYNNQLLQSFLSLAPTQMSKVLNSPFTLDNDVFKLELTSESELNHVPIFNHALYFLKKLQEVGEFKATQKGNLPKAFVIELYEEFFTNEKYARRPNKEDDLPQATRLKHLLDIAGLIKKRNNKFSLTKKGSSILEKNKNTELFEILFINFANKWNWAYMDGYAELYLIQQSVAFNFLLIHKKCVDWTLDKDLGQFYLEAFPELVREVPHESYSTPESQIINVFILRFLRRFCLPLGLVEYKEVKEKTEEKYKLFDRYEYYRPTTFFRKNIKFKIK